MLHVPKGHADYNKRSFHFAAPSWNPRLETEGAGLFYCFKTIHTQFVDKALNVSTILYFSLIFPSMGVFFFLFSLFIIKPVV